MTSEQHSKRFHGVNVLLSPCHGLHHGQPSPWWKKNRVGNAHDAHYRMRTACVTHIDKKTCWTPWRLHLKSHGLRNENGSQTTIWKMPPRLKIGANIKTNGQLKRKHAIVIHDGRQIAQKQNFKTIENVRWLRHGEMISTADEKYKKNLKVRSEVASN